MRFCPFCSAENADELAVCQACGRRLPPLPPRRARNAPPTGVQLPPRAVASPPPVPRAASPHRAPSPPPPPPVDRSGSTVSPPAADRSGATVVSPPPVAPLLGADESGATVVSPPPVIEPASSPPGPPDPRRQALLDAITPGPAAHRREPPPHDRGEPARGRRAGDGVPGAAPLPRAKPPTQPPPQAVPARPAVAPAPRALRPSEGPALPPPGPHAPPAPLAPPPVAPAPAYPTVPRTAFNDDFNTAPAADPIHVAARRIRAEPGAAGSGAAGSGIEPPPTRIQRADGADRPFTPPKVSPVPEIPEPGLINAARYALRFAQARWQRRGAIKTLGAEIKQDTEALDQVLGALGREARNARVEGRVFSAENAAITAAEDRVAQLAKEHGDVDARKADENSKFVDVERERNAKLVEAERLVDEAGNELAHLEGQRRGLRDKRKELERHQKSYLKSAEDREREAGNAQMGDTRAELRRSAEDFRKRAAALEPERQDMDRKLAALERPINEATAKLDAAKAELDAAKRSLNDAREGHTHRLAELDAEQKRKAREIALAEAEIQRRLVTLGTLVNLNRIEDPAFAELYQRIDRIRGAITARTTEIEKLTAEREAYDRGALVRGVSTIGGAIVLVIALIVILRAAL